MTYLSNTNTIIAFSTSSLLTSGTSYSSPVLDLGGWTQVETHIVSDVSGLISIEFLGDLAGTDVLRTLTIPYSGGNQFETFGAPAFTPYVKYTYTNGVTDQTDFYFDTKFSKVATSPQILGADAFISSKMVTQLNRSVLVGKTHGGDFYDNVGIDTEGDLEVNIRSPKTGFGELNVAGNTPVVQGVATYNKLPDGFIGFTAVDGSAFAEDQMFVCDSGSTAFGYAAIQSQRSVTYSPGIGSLARFTAKFDSSAANVWQGVGLINLGDELSFGYSGVTFGIWYRHNGRAEVQTLTVTGAAAEDIALTLNGTEYNFALTGATVNDNAWEISKYLNTNTTVWGADQIDNTVIINSRSDGSKPGTYILSGLTTVSGSFAQNVSGVTKTSVFTPQSEWNMDVMDGTGGASNKTGVDLNPQKGNVYQITYQYLGFGNITFLVESPLTGEFEKVHMLRYANSETVPSLGNPALKMGAYCADVSGTLSSPIRVSCGSLAGFIQGEQRRTKNTRALTNTSTVTTSFTNSLSIRNRKTFNGYINQTEVLPDTISFANEGTKSLEVTVSLLRTTSGVQDYQLINGDENDSVVDFDTTTSTHTEGILIGALVVSPTSTSTIDLGAKNTILSPGDQLIIQAKKASGASTEVSVSLSWYEV